MSSQSAFIRNRTEEMQLIFSEYFETLERAGVEIVTEMKLSKKTKKQLEKKFVSDEIYIEQTRKNLKNILNKLRK